jgi:RHS repeat-associated protein
MDNEVKGTGNMINYKYRVHDPRIGRFLSVDPLTAQYPHNSPYAFSENVVINAVELEGLEKIEINSPSTAEAIRWQVDNIDALDINDPDYNDKIDDHIYRNYTTIKNIAINSTVDPAKTESARKLYNSDYAGDIVDPDLDHMEIWHKGELLYSFAVTEALSQVTLGVASKGFNTPGSPAMDGLWMLNDQLAPDYIGIYLTYSKVSGGGAAVDLNFGYKRKGPGPSWKLFTETKGGIGYDKGPSAGFLFGWSKLDNPSWSSMGGFGTYGSGTLFNINGGYSNSMVLNPETGKYKVTWNFINIGGSSSKFGGSGGVNVNLNDEFLRDRKND